MDLKKLMLDLEVECPNCGHVFTIDNWTDEDIDLEKGELMLEVPCPKCSREIYGFEIVKFKLVREKNWGKLLHEFIKGEFIAAVKLFWVQRACRCHKDAIKWHEIFTFVRSEGWL